MAMAMAHILLFRYPPYSPAPSSKHFHPIYSLAKFSLSKTTRKQCLRVTCSTGTKPSSAEISSAAKIRSEVLSPFRTVRMFFYLAFIASGSLGGLIATTQLISALTNASKADQVPEILKSLGVDLGAIALFVFLYSRELSAKNAQLARLSREESLSNLKMRVDQKVITVGDLRGFARLVILSGPASFIKESIKLSEPYADSLLERGVRVVPIVTDGGSNFEVEDVEEEIPDEKKKKLWQLFPMFPNEWFKWLDDQKELAKVAKEAPVYISLRMDGRVRGSGVGYPPWSAFVAQLPRVKGLWSGLLDGMDGRV
ncbi:protein LOW PSII ACCUMULATION 1, chloroplastic isoform X1 [Amborella trichopoda]|nr:protein LOW PSII ACCUMULATION 1, chloroplastic isoform X1 [Amborella trichopoda]XP_011627036.1 protein LOW PSII ACCUMULATION 1, chloroplastic isoform X1 [Amborella trichopoda]XP_020529243.1 protein LOW PSII ACCUMULATION 1, chloroplastic isoform X1 [Amborella trichopoda]XP_020529244.1 protein LOW PSII ACCUMULATION 1, chloroplastic isoform X1 [Amborella trichopoda]|eukprot:XP_006854329.2 protein LOW PSII ACCUMULATION 1, chloroplastic isoform X1 [Amborella trichopoda]